MARVRVLTMKFPRVTKIGQLIASMRTTPQVSGLGPVTVYIARFKCRAGPSLPLPTGLGPPESSTGPSPLDTFTLPNFLLNTNVTAFLTYPYSFTNDALLNVLILQFIQQLSEKKKNVTANNHTLPRSLIYLL